jgi:hypothetical protein
MKAYAIRHTKTGHLLPVEYNKGSTYWEGQAGSLPRLFPSLKSVRGCVNTWIKGEASHEFTETEFGIEAAGLVYRDKGRKRSDLEIVTFELVEIPTNA